MTAESGIDGDLSSRRPFGWAMATTIDEARSNGFYLRHQRCDFEEEAGRR